MSGKTLPYIDNTINLLIAEDLRDIPMDEVLRVLVPQGVAYVGSDGNWQTTVKPRPKEIDDWTHYLHDPSGNAVAHDDVVGPPRHLQWLGNPRWSRHHDRMASMSALVSSGGKLFYVMDEGSRISIQTPSDWKLIARDAFNGMILWKRDIKDWQNHLWPLKSGPTQLARRLVAEGGRLYVTLGFRSPLSVLDAATGETLMALEDSSAAEEVLVANDAVYVLVNKADSELKDYIPAHNVGDQARVRKEYLWNEQPREIHAYAKETGKLLWSHASPVAPLSLATDGARVFYHDGQKVAAVDCGTGVMAWAGNPVPRRSDVQMNFGLRLLVYDGVVLFAGGDRTMSGYDAAAGERLWSSPHERSGYESPEDLLVAGGLVWSWATTTGKDSAELTGRDPRTGEVKSQFSPNVDTYWFHHRCYIAKATDKYIMPSRTGIEFVDFQKQDWEIHHWVRGGCLYGVMPANGLLYAPPHNCACYPEAKLYGFNALASASPSRAVPPIADGGRLERGPAYEALPAQREATRSDVKSESSDLKSEISDRAAGATTPPSADNREAVDSWPTFRHDAQRSGKTPASLSSALNADWKADLGGTLSAVVVADGRLLVSQIDQHLVHCLDAESGETQWSFTAGGRVDSPPTISSGRAYFGCADGWVYCVRMADGVLVWRFRAAPVDRRMMAYEQLESVWPVNGSVLVQDDAVSFVAGRSNFLDGGLRMIKLDAASGELLTEKILDEKDPETGENIQARLQTLQMPVGLPDILSSDGSYVYMRSQRFDLDGNRLEIGPNSGIAEEQGAAQHGDGAHLFAPMGYLDDTYFHRAYWVYGRSFAGGHNGYWQAGRFAPSGRLLVFDDDTVYGYGRKPEYYRWTTTIEHQLFSTSKEPPEVPDLAASRRGQPVSIVRFGSPKGHDVTGKPITIEAWIKPQQPGGVIVARGAGQQGFALCLDGAKPQFVVRQDGELTSITAPNALTGDWVHLAGMLTADRQLRLYVDGKRVAEAAVKSLFTADPQEGMEIGADDGGAAGAYQSPNGFSGIIDEVRLYYSELTDAEIASRSNGAIGEELTASPTVLSCSFDDGAAADASGNGYDGQVTGATAVRGRQGQGLQFVTRTKPAVASYVKMNWTQDIPLYARAMVMADEQIFLCGPPDLIDEESTFKQIMQGEEAVQQQLARQDAALKGESGGVLLAVSAADGTAQAKFDIDALPVWDGMAIAEGRLFIATTDGRILSFRGPGDGEPNSP
ncbi:MAG: PQQ-binding-like beta-propeller repeat protein [Planctomycetaceae bacterium]